MIRPAAILAAAALLATAGCAGAAPTPGGRALTIFAAASLTKVLPAIEAGFRTAHPQVAFTISIGSSAAVATQIEEGAPADLFLSADEVNAHRLIDDGLVAGDAVAFATNRLAVIVPASNPAAIRTPADLARRGVKIVAAGSEVPITMYANRLVANLALLPGYPTGFAAAYQANVVTREDDVSGVLTKVSLDEGDAGIVYATDAESAADALQRIEIPVAANVAATYAGVALKDAVDRALATELLSWLSGEAGRSVLSGYGFGAAP